MLEYLLFLVFAILLSMLFKPRKYGMYIVIVSLCLGILAFNMEVLPASDLTRHYSYVDMFRYHEVGLSYALERLNPVTMLYFWLFSFLPDNSFLPAISTFLCYYFMLKLAVKACDDAKMPKSVYITCFSIILMSYNFYVMSNSIRMWLVFSIFFYVLYDDVVRGRKRIVVWIIYLVLVFFHYGTLILLASRILAMILKNIKKLNILQFVGLILCACIGVAFMSTDYFSIYIIGKIIGYAEYTTRGTWQSIIGLVRMGMVCGLIIPALRNVNEKYKEYLYVIIGVCLATLILYKNYVMILRFGDAVIAASSIPIVCYYKKCLLNTQRNKNVLTIPQCFLWGGAILSYGAISFFDYQYLFFNI